MAKKTTTDQYSTYRHANGDCIVQPAADEAPENFTCICTGTHAACVLATGADATPAPATESTPDSTPAPEA